MGTKSARLFPFPKLKRGLVWRNSPELKFHSLPRDPKVFAQYVRLIRNGNLKEFSITDNTKICGKHFPNGERVCRTQLPTIFPWSKPVKRRRDIIKYDLPLRSDYDNRG